MKRERIIKDAERELIASGYSTVLAEKMHTCADVFAEKRGRKFIIKIVYNIDSVTKDEARDLHKLSQFLNAEPIVLASVSKRNKLKHNVTYRRFAIRCVSPDVFPEIASDNMSLLAEKSVGIKARIDRSKLHNLRKINNLAIEDLAQRSKLSKVTLYLHEREDRYAAIGTISRLEQILNGSIRSENVIENKKINLRANELAKTGMQALHLSKAPFDIVAKDKNYYEISLDANIRTLVKRAALFKELKEKFENNYPFFINERSSKIEGVRTIKKKELMQVSSEDELLSLIG
jgi:putative transcriptional regulator